MSKKKKKIIDPFDKTWITENSLDVIAGYNPGELTLRGLHYRLVGLGMTNTVLHYKAVVRAMTAARWASLVPFGTFSDHDREIVGKARYEETDVDNEIQEAKETIELYMRAYYKNRWENQPNYIEVWIEKKALIGTFKPVCQQNGIILAPCKGYPSLTFLYEAAQRLKIVEDAGKEITILYFGDHDPSGDDIPRSLKEKLGLMGVYVDLDRIALNKNQVIEWNLPPAPVKQGDSRSQGWDGLGQVELDAIEPRQLKELCEDAISNYFDDELFDELHDTEQTEGDQYRDELKVFIKEMVKNL